MRSIASRLIVAALLTLSLAACHKAGGPLTTDDMSLGNPDSKVTVIESGERLLARALPGLRA